MSNITGDRPSTTPPAKCPPQGSESAEGTHPLTGRPVAPNPSDVQDTPQSFLSREQGPQEFQRNLRQVRRTGSSDRVVARPSQNHGSGTSRLTRPRSKGDASVAPETASYGSSKPASTSARLGSVSQPGAIQPSILERLEDIPTSSGTHKCVKCQERCIVVAKVGELRTPFYLSSGRVAKEGVSPGHWYPFFGRDGFWLSKITSGNRGISKYYGSPTLADIAKRLDSELGDIRNSEDVPTVGWEEATWNVINRDVRPVTRPSDEIGEQQTRLREKLSQNLLLVDLLDAPDEEARLAASEKLAARDWALEKRHEASEADGEKFIKERTQKYFTAAPRPNSPSPAEQKEPRDPQS